MDKSFVNKDFDEPIIIDNQDNLDKPKENTELIEPNTVETNSVTQKKKTIRGKAAREILKDINFDEDDEEENKPARLYVLNQECLQNIRDINNKYFNKDNINAEVENYMSKLSDDEILKEVDKIRNLEKNLCLLNNEKCFFRKKPTLDEIAKAKLNIKRRKNEEITYKLSEQFVKDYEHLENIHCD